MKLIRVYDDRKVFYNNVDWKLLCEDDLSVEYCTLDDRNDIKTTISKNADEKEEKHWNMKNEDEYFVLLDTKWDKSKIVNQYEINGDIVIPLQIIQHLQSANVTKIGVYSLYDLDMAGNLIKELKAIEGLSHKVIPTLFNFHLFQPDKIINDIKNIIY